MKSFCQLFLIAGLSISSISNAYELNINGFSNIAISQHDQNNNDELTYGDIEATSKFVDTSAGLSFNIDITNKWSSTILLMSEYDSVLSSYNSTFDIFQLKYDYNSSFQFRVGRIRASQWLYSEVIQVGALSPWIRPPVQVYGKNPVNSMMGMMFSYSKNIFGDFMISSDFYWGSESSSFSAPSQTVKFQAKDYTGINLSLSNDTWTVKVSTVTAFTTATAETEITTYTCAYNPAGAPCAAGGIIPVSSTLETDFSFKKTTVSTVGLKHDNNKMLFIYERVRTTTENEAYEIVEAHYATIGYYFAEHEYLLHLTHSADVGERKALATPSSESSLIVGLTYQHSQNLVFKVEYEKLSISEENEVYIAPTNISQNTNVYPDRDVNIFGVSANLVF